MLEKEFVPFEEALELKELKFDGSCFGEYRQWDGNEPWLQLYQDLDGCSTDPADYEYTVEAKAPTYSQAFRWFRENYNMIHSIEAAKNNKWYYWTNVHNSDIPVYNTYEEAELDCLRTLIEIAKEKQ